MSADDDTKIIRAVGKLTRFKYPGSEGERLGILKFREIARSAEGVTGAWYWTVVDVIAFDGDPEPWLRVGYFRRPAGTTARKWGSQTTYCGPIAEWRGYVLPALERLMEKAGGEHPN